LQTQKLADLGKLRLDNTAEIGAYIENSLPCHLKEIFFAVTSKNPDLITTNKPFFY
jgi:hypothetical protein